MAIGRFRKLDSCFSQSHADLTFSKTTLKGTYSTQASYSKLKREDLISFGKKKGLSTCKRSLRLLSRVSWFYPDMIPLLVNCHGVNGSEESKKIQRGSRNRFPVGITHHRHLKEISAWLSPNLQLLGPNITTSQSTHTITQLQALTKTGSWLLGAKSWTYPENTATIAATKSAFTIMSLGATATGRQH